MGYVDLESFKLQTVMPDGDVDYLVERAPGFIESSIGTWESWIEARLRKRYATPFVAPFPPILIQWIVTCVTVDAYRKRGFNPSDPTMSDLIADRDRTLAEIREAADSKDGLFDLPLRADNPTSAVTSGGPLGYSETSPYVWTDVQADAGRDDDRSGRGS